jgi:hypothetical protein
MPRRLPEQDEPDVRWRPVYPPCTIGSMCPRTPAPLLAILSALGVCACGGGAAEAPEDAGASQGDAASPGPFRPLLTASWTLPPGSERYRCARRTLAEDVTIRAFQPTAPLGTHHTVLSLADGARPDGDHDCGPIAGERAIYMSGVGSPPFELPEGVAVRLRAGQQLVLNLHLYNTDADHPLSGISGVEVAIAPGDTQVAQAEVILAGPLGFVIDPGRQERTFRCTTTTPVTLFAIGPHMHRLGIGMLVTRGEEVLLDVPYSFDDQRFYPVGPIALAAGDRLDVTCIWNNDTGAPVSFGDSSDEEMCFAMLYRHPAVPGATFCLH